MEDDDTDLEMAMALQDVALPAGVPVLPAIDVAARFFLPESAREPVGNWFDVAVLPDDRVALVVGEVPGTGIASSATMGQVRALVRGSLRCDGDVVAALRLADVYADDNDEARGTTVVIAVVDPDGPSVSYATAGHPPPLVLSESGSATLLARTGAGPLGTGVGTGFTAPRTPLQPGDVVLLTSASAHLAESPIDSVVATAAGTVHDPSTAFADLDAVIGRLLESSGDEPLTVSAARVRTAPHRSLRLPLASADGAVRQAREELSAWLDELQASAMDQMALVHATAELVTNAVEHGGGGGSNGVAELRAGLGGNGVVLVEVLDTGSWQAPSDDLERGRGLAMAAGLVDQLGISSDGAGTRALLQHRLSVPVPIQSGHSVRAAAADPVEIQHGPARQVAMRGAFGNDDVERVAAEILVATRGGTIDLDLDLTAVTTVSTSAIRLLADLTSVNRSVGTTTAGIRIHTTAGSVPARSLDSARIPHHAS